LRAAVKEAKRRPAAVSPQTMASKPGAAEPREMFERATKQLTLNFPAVLDGESEAIHQFRISVRRLRGLLELYQPLLQHDWFSHHREELRFLGHSVGTLRDTDVLQQNISDAAVKLDDSCRDALAPLHAALAQHRRQQHEQAKALLRSPRYEELIRSLPAAAFKVVASPRRRVTPPNLTEALVRPVQRAAARLTRHSDPAEFHRLRIRIKRLRYALEMLDEGRSEQAKSVVKKLKNIQEILGIQHDLVAAMSWLREAATSAIVPGPSLLAAGSVYQVLYRRSLKLSRQAWKKSKTVRERDNLQSLENLTVEPAHSSHKVDAA
jgi:CHAD domain-containing protein